ncbi:sporulation phosphorelay system protein KapB [Alkalihalobacillus sp. AL-G]|uniref:sporulation phosphorelay system protein KapB n=1 Tax=Alkalihalobacillus sp. AL-G TaxID=2926399 RepID=UPI00272C362E|nr:sporulation phosphorelay system protein KapB [Alkalihalobacillus sp. AL-G]WLD91546.1 kinase-associated lipoprotein B [Alkalihalobacillus sp. AL-G]
MSIEKGNMVTASYKTGRYIGKVIESKPSMEKAVVEILAVLVHPKQGDLHSPNNADVTFFHERPALAFTEKALVPLTNIKKYDKAVPDYRESLLNAVHLQISNLSNEGSDYAKLALQRLNTLKDEYESKKN